MLDVGTVLAETRESPPCGPNLEHDLSFFELEEAARGKPEQRTGDAVKPAEDPNWPKVIDRAQALLNRSKDLRVAVHLTRTSAELSTDTIYQRAARRDNLLRWDLEVPAGTVGEKALDVTYEFRIEYARDLPPPRFGSGGLAEAPVGGGAMGGGMGGMGGGFRSITVPPPAANQATRAAGRRSD